MIYLYLRSIINFKICLCYQKSFRLKALTIEYSFQTGTSHILLISIKSCEPSEYDNKLLIVLKSLDALGPPIDGYKLYLPN